MTVLGAQPRLRQTSVAPRRRPARAPLAPRNGCAELAGYARIRLAAVATDNIDADLELLRRIAGRDENALASLYDRHSRLAYSVIVRILRSASDAEDVLQETFVRIWSRAESYDSHLGSPQAWLIRIARNRAIDRLRATRTRAAIAVEPASAPTGDRPRVLEPETHETPHALLQEQSTASAIRVALATLPDAQRRLIEAAFFDGFTHHELSTRFGVPLGTVKTRIRTGLLAMRGQLEHTV